VGNAFGLIDHDAKHAAASTAFQLNLHNLNSFGIADTPGNISYRFHDCFVYPGHFARRQ
jgi:hypothetical protein